MKNKKVTFERQSNIDYLKSFPGTFLILIKHFTYLVFYYYVNFVLGRKRAKIGKNSKIHPTVILRQAERITIGENCLINHKYSHYYDLIHLRIFLELRKYHYQIFLLICLAILHEQNLLLNF